MAKSSKAISKMVNTDVDKALANISASTPKPDMSASDSELKSAMAPQKAPSFAEAFRTARAKALDGGPKTFTWAGKSYSTKMAGEGASRPAAAAPRRSGTGSTGSAVADFYLNKYPKIKNNAASIRGVSAAESAAAQAKAGRSNVSAKPAEAKTRTGTSQGATIKDASGRTRKVLPGGELSGREMLSNWFSSRREELRQATAPARAREAQLAAERDKRLAERAAARRKELGIPEPTKSTGGSVKKYAKGGKIDGCAIRGKTRAMKKGK